VIANGVATRPPIAPQDVWELHEGDGILTRQHVVARTRLFCPGDATQCPIDADCISSHRISYISEGEKPAITHLDNWLKPEVDPMIGSTPWIGKTVFTLKELLIKGVRQEASLSTRHLMTHMPMNKWCDACQRTKAQHVPARNPGGSRIFETPPTKFGERVTLDYLVTLDNKDKEIDDGRNAAVIYDVGTKWHHCHPTCVRDLCDAVEALNEFTGPNDYIHFMHSDCAPEIIKAAKDLGYCHDESMPGRPQANGIAEAACKRVLFGVLTWSRWSSIEVVATCALTSASPATSRMMKKATAHGEEGSEKEPFQGR
jgi:hypothetical protein